MTPNIRILAWAPDADPTTPGVLADVENMLPTARGYAPEPGLAASDYYPLTLTKAPAGGASISYDYSDVPFVATDLTISGFFLGNWTTLNRAGTAYVAATVDNPWHFASFSTTSAKVIALAVQVDNILQEKTDTTAGVFANVTAAPAADTIAVQRGFVLLGNYTTGGVQTADGWICSALEDHRDWTPDIATQCAAGRLTATNGQIIRLIAFRDYVIAFKRYSMYRGTYVGAADNTWSWPVVSRSVGLVSHDAVCEAEGVLYWLSHDGFYRWAGGEVQRIQSAPWEWMRTVFASSAFLGYREQCVWDEAQRVVRWLFPSPILSPTTQMLQLTYHPETDRWGKRLINDAAWMFKMPALQFWTSPTGGVAWGRAVSYFVQSGGNYVLSIPRDIAGTGQTSLTTGDIGDDDEAFALTRARARFIRSPDSSTMTHYHRMNLGDALTTGETIARSDGKYDVSHSARWHRLKFTQAGMYEVSGFRVETPTAGKR